MRIPIKTTIGVLAALGASIAIPGLAGADSNTVTAVTHDGQHPDTTSVSGPCTGTSDNGPTWATDNLSFRFSVNPESGPGNYSVTIYADGGFKAFADPNTGECATFNGSVHGWIQYDVSSTTPPDPSNLPSQSPDTSQGTMLSELFDGNATIVGGGHYSYTYNQVDGAPYTQTG